MGVPFVDDIFGGGGSGDAQANASVQAAKIAAESHEKWLNYLMETEEIPQQVRQGALQNLSMIYGIPLEGQTPEEAMQYRADFISGLTDDPLYKAQLAGQEEAVLRNQATAGQLRGGETISQLGQVQNQALLNTYGEQVGGLQSLAGTPTNAAQIAQMGTQIGDIQAAGITGAAAAQAQAQQQGFSNLLGLGSLGLTAFALSDPRLKESIKHVKTEGGVKWYEWVWNSKAKKLFGLSGKDMGVLTNEHPECCRQNDLGFLEVDYKKIFEKVSAYA